MTHASTTELADLSGLARDFFTKEVAPRHEEFAAAGEPTVRCIAVPATSGCY